MGLRSDFVKYNNGADKIENFLPIVQGPVTGRDGTRFVHEVLHYTEAEPANLIDFEVSADQAYIQEFGLNYIRFYKNGGLIVESPQLVTNTFNNGGEVQIEIVDHGYCTGDYVIIEGVTGTIEANGEWQITVNSADLFTLNGSAFFNAFGGGGTSKRIVQRVTQYIDLDNISLRYAQSLDVLYLVSNLGNHALSKLSRFSDISWTFEIPTLLNGPYGSLNRTDTTLDPSATTGGAKATGEINYDNAGSPVNPVDGDTVQIGADTYTFKTTLTPAAFEILLHATIADVSWGNFNKALNGECGAGIYYGLGTTSNFNSSHDTNANVLSLTAKSSGTAGNVTITLSATLIAAGVTKVDPSGGTDGITIVASSIFNINGGIGFQPGDVGRLVRLKHSSTFGYARITAVTDTLTVAADVIDDFGAATETDDWQLGLFSTFTGFPTAIGIYEQRLFLGIGDTIAASFTGDYEDFSPSDPDGTITDSHGFTFRLGSDKANKIKWILAGKQLMVGTQKGEWSVFGSSDAAIASANVSARRHTAHGSNDTQPVFAENTGIFVQKSGLKLRGMEFRFESDGFQADELTQYADHILNSGVTDMAYAPEPFSTIWIVRNDGVMTSFTYNKRQEVQAFARQITQGEWLNVAVITSFDGSYDESWFIVKRVIGLNDKFYIERMVPNMHVDSSLSYSGSPVGTVSGLDHLEGKTVSIIGDGAVYPEDVVESGAIVLDGPEASVIDVGLSFIPFLRTVSPEIVMPNGGTSHGRPRRWSEISVRLFETLGLEIEGDQVPFRSSDDEMDAPPEIFTGDVRVSNTGWDRRGHIEIRQNQPLPVTILGVFGRLEIGD